MLMDRLKEIVFLNNSLHQYLLALGIFAAIFLSANILLILVSKILIKVNERFMNTFLLELTKSAQKRLKPVIFMIALSIARMQLDIPKKYGKLWFTFVTIVIIIFVVLFLCDFISNFIDNYLSVKSEVVVSEGIITLIKSLVWILGFLTILANLGVNVNTFVAGLGVGGVAVAFAAQSIVADLFNYCVILFDRPFLKGDFIQVEQDLGTVEYIGIKSTRIRRNSGEQLLISNTNLLASRIQNYRILEKRRKYMVLRVEYNTPLEKLKKLPDIIQNIIESTPNTEFMMARFTEFTECSLNFEVIYYVLTPDYIEFVVAVENINHRIIEEFDKLGVNFAFPSITLYINKNDDQADASIDNVYNADNNKI